MTYPIDSTAHNELEWAAEDERDDAQRPTEGEILAAEVIAKRFHEAYEALAPRFGYKTRDAGAKPWAEVPADNRALMVATVDHLLAEGVIEVGSC
jgi:hypothetical protein